MQRAVAIIPARFNSTRFPGKPLASLHGKAIIQLVYEHTSSASMIEKAIVATDDNRIYDAVREFGGNAVMTSMDHSCGTDRIAEAAEDIECDIIVNVQGDEPFIKHEMVDQTVSLLAEDERASMSTLCVKIRNNEELLSPNVVKVVTDNDGYALYFSRAPIPYYRDDWQTLNSISFKSNRNVLFKHIGIYGYRKEVLFRLTKMAKNSLEDVEKLEQLRALSAGIKIKVGETKHDTLGIDTIEDLRKAEEWQSISL